MKYVYAIRDVVASAIIGGLFCERSDAPMVRLFSDGLADSSSILNKHPRDFELVCLGELNDETSDTELSGYDRPRVVLTGSAWLESRQEGGK